MAGSEALFSKVEVNEFVQRYTNKRTEEWKLFSELLTRLREFHETALTGIPALQHVRQQWEWNMVAEWVLRRLQDG